MSIKNKYFSVEEANAFIPKLLIDIPRIQDLMKRLVNDFPDVRKWQIVQNNLAEITFCISCKIMSNERLQELKDQIRKRLPENIKYNIIQNGSFIKTGAGKIPTFISKL